MKIALDFDGVLSHTMKSWVRICNGLNNNVKPLTMRDIDVYEFFNKWDMTLKECFEIFDIAWSEWEKLEPLEQDIGQKTHILCNLGKTDIVTNVTKKWQESIRMWLKCQGVEYSELVFSRDKWELNYDVYIDDAAHNAERIVEAGNICLLYNQPWNRHINTKDGYKYNNGGQIYRVYSLYHAIDVIKDLMKANDLT